MDSRKFFRVLQLISSLVGIAVIACAAYFGYGFYKEYKAHQAKSSISQLAPDTQKPNPKASAGGEADSAINWDHIIKQTKEPSTESSAQESAIKESTTQNKAAQGAGNTPESTKPAIKTLAPKSQKPKTKKPMLAIIMDDMAYRSQLNDLQKLNLPITPSFFPVSPDSPDTAQLAALTPFYMVHLPLEAQNPLQTRQKWLLESSSRDEMHAYMSQIKQDFPRLMFINNHTGSRFTANERAMSSLLSVLDELGIEFVDSRTSADTAAPKLYKLARKPLLQRDVFLDNTPNLAYTTSQLKLAITTAKKKGYAIAIAHPHQSTFKALANAKYTLFKDVELVYIKDLPIAKSLLAQNLAKNKSAKPSATGSASAAQVNGSGVASGGGAAGQAPALPALDSAPQSEIAKIFEESENPARANSQNLDTASAIPHNNYLDPLDPQAQHTPDPVESTSSGALADSSASTQGGVQGEIQASASGELESSTPHASFTPAPKPSQIDRSMFEEVKRQSEAKAQKMQDIKAAKASKKPAAKPESKSSAKGHAKAEDIKDCEQSEVEAFISGCPSDRQKQEKPQGFINIEWSSEKAQNAKHGKGERADFGTESKKPKDFLDASEF